MNKNETKTRCGWCGNDPLYVKYHDEEWGCEVTDDKKMFEFLTLESAQAGLSWITILRRRNEYRHIESNTNIIPIDIATSVMEDSKSYPRIIASMAEKSCRLHANENVKIVGKIANDDKWFD